MRTTALASAVLAAAALPALAQPTYTAQPLVTGLSRPVQVLAAPGDATRLFILEQRSGTTGRVRIYDRTISNILATPFVTVPVSTSSEQGLLGMAFHPDYANNGLFYLNYTRPDGDTVIAEYAVSTTNPDLADASSARTVLVLDQPFSNHNAGWIGFGPDGFLYIPTGDGGSANDPGNRAQNLASPLGKILRIDIDAGDDFPADNDRNFALPADNPFLSDSAADPAIWAFGLRNPFRNDFDPATGDLYLADVGQNAREEINFQPAGSPGGENYGWRCWEGTRQNFTTATCPLFADTVPPIAEYTHDDGCSVTGGIVYRGCAIPSLRGAFLYADYCSNNIWTTRSDGLGGWITENITARVVTNGLSSISSFGRDAQGGLYATSLFGGTVYRITSDEPNADRNNDGNVNFADVALFVAAYAAVSNDADINNDGLINLADVQDFITAFNLGC